MKILIVDDNFQSRRLAQYILGSLGHEVYTAESGKVSLEILQQNQIEVIILDWNMPELNGRNTILEYEKLSLKIKNRLNIIIYTSYPLNELSIPSAKRIAIGNYISKKLTPHKQMINFRKSLRLIELKLAG